ncbi:YpmS family protein [Peribacillus sp. SCS-37]|uniref:YpmS family protein n=1 Tax=Paraperibacillus esterisolvens TaxID=3115296 RepID=UPI003905B24D
MNTEKKWKVLFFALLGFNVIVLLALVILANLPAKGLKGPDNDPKKENVGFDIHTNKKDLNILINRYLQEELSGGIDYEVLLKDDVELYGIMPAFGKNLEIKLDFEPKALKNGDLLLQQKSISVGKMKLPVSYVLNVINFRYKTPDWVIIQPQDESIYVSLQNMKLKSGFKVRAQKFDLKEDKISFRLSFPEDK